MPSHPYAFAVDAVAEAGLITRAVQRELLSGDVLRKDDQSPVTVADFAAQAIIARRLATAEPGVVLVGEESAAMLKGEAQRPLRRALVTRLRTIWADVTEDEALATIDIGAQAPSDRFWTLDPIDGTKGFMRDGQYAISLALIERGRVVFGVLGCPNLSADLERPFDDPDPHGLIVWAARGAGTWAVAADAHRGNAVPVRHVPADDGALRVCGSAASGHSDQRAAARVLAALGGARVAHLDSQAKYAVVARGQADCYLRIPLRVADREYIWDHAPGEIIAIEAGARVSDIAGHAFDFGVGERLQRNGGILCAAPPWHPRVLQAISEDPEISALLRARGQ